MFRFKPTWKLVEQNGFRHDVFCFDGEVSVGAHVTTLSADS
jgi:hypothetical protein